MKTKILLFAFFLLTVQTVFSQLKVNDLGNIGIGTNYPSSEFKCHIKGHLLVTNYPTSPTHELRIKMGGNLSSPCIGSNTDKIYFWSDYALYNKLYAQGYYIGSDSTLKENKKQINNTLNTLMKLNSYSFNFKNSNSDLNTSTKTIKNKKTFGYIAQEVELFLPEIVDTTGFGHKMINYTAIIPLLTEAIKEQQNQITDLKDMIIAQEELIQEIWDDKISGDLLDNTNSKKKNTSTMTSVESQDQSDAPAKLFDNVPNPFTDRTVINCYIPNQTLSSFILIHDYAGREVKTIEIIQKGNSQVIIEGSELQSGLYLYTLLIDNKIVDTKKMLITQN